MLDLSSGAGGETRTLTMSPLLDFESSVSTISPPRRADLMYAQNITGVPFCQQVKCKPAHNITRSF